MCQVWTHAPVAETIARIVQCILRTNGDGHVVSRGQVDDQADSSYRVLSYRGDFPYLWDFELATDHKLIPWILSEHHHTSTADNSRDRTIILVWDGIPDSIEMAINIASYVTPFDWALALSRTVFRECRGKRKPTEPREQQLPALRVLIIDLQSQLYEESFGQKAFAAVASSLPWVQVYRPVVSEPLLLLAAETSEIRMFRAAIPPGKCDAECLIEDLKDSSRIPSLSDIQKDASSPHGVDGDDDSCRDYEGIVTTLSRLWATNLTSVTDRHHVGNLLAPYILAGGLSKNLSQCARAAIENAVDRPGGPNRENVSLRTALVSLAKAVGLDMSSDKGTGKGKVLSEDFYAADIHGRRQRIRFLLVDDQYSLGYHHFLSYLLFGSDYEPTQGKSEHAGWTFTDNAGGSLSTLRCEGSTAAILKALSVEEKVDDWKEPRHIDLPCDVLLLDLRLWTDEAERKAALQQVVDRCNTLQSQAINTIDRHFRDAFAAANQIVAGKSADELQAIALLPLLLSHYDPSLPIVIFSSSHQRAVTEMLAHRPNIILTFTKPIFTGYGDIPNPVDIVEQLRLALDEAILLHECRSLWLRLSALKEITPQCYTIKDSSPSSQSVYYNLAAAKPREWTQVVDGGPKAFPLAVKDTQRYLSALFLRYIVEQRFRDFGSVPWEFLEGLLKPSSASKLKLEFPGPDPSVRCYPRRNCIALALELCRHRKVHGRFEDIDATEKSSRGIAVVMYRLLLDLLSCPSTSSIPPRSLAADIRSGLKSKYGHLTRPPSAISLTGDKLVTWEDFAVLSMAEATLNAGDSISSEAVGEIIRLAYKQKLGVAPSPTITVQGSGQLDRSKLTHIVGAETMAKVKCITESRTGTGASLFHVEMKNCSDAWLVKMELNGRSVDGVALRIVE